MKKKWIFLLIGFLLLMTLIPVPSQLDMVNDKVEHFILYFFFTLFVSYIKRINIYVVLFLFSIGMLFEYLQTFLPYRDFELNDMIANSLGITIALIIVALIKWRNYVWNCRNIQQKALSS